MLFSAGTAAVAVAGILASLKITKKPLKDNVFVFQGAGEVMYGERERERIKSCRSCGNTPWLIFIHRNTKYNLCIYSYVYAKYNKTVIHVTIQNYNVWFY